MVRRILFLILASALVLSACSTVLSGGSPDEPVSSDDPNQGSASPDEWAPQAGDEDLAREEVEINQVDILTLESFPPQFMLHVTGSKGTPCSELRVVVSDPDEQNRIAVEIYTVIDPAAICIQVLEEFDINIPMGTFEDGEYSVWVNGVESETITTP